MMRSMYAGVSGLRVHQSKMDVIGNNISNVNTVGFKSERMTFSDMFYQTLQGASGSNPESQSGGINPMQIGLGANVASIDSIMTEGAAQRTDRPLDMKIEGNGFFIVNNSDGNFFSRAGVFSLDNQGYLANPEGYRLMGWNVDDNGKIQQGQVQPMQVYSNRFSYSKPNATTNAQVYGNINKTDERLKGPSTSDGYIFTMPIYDKLGHKFTVTYSLTENDDKSSATDRDFKIKLKTITDSAGNDITIPTDVKLDIDGTPPGSEIGILFNDDGSLASATNKFSLKGLDKIADTLEADVKVDMKGMTLYAGKTNIETKRGDENGIGAGREPGNLSGFSVDKAGIIIGKYTNGDKRQLGQVVVATFSNPSGLQKKGSNLFEATPNSGDFDGIGDDIQSTGGAMTSGVLEMSNVDLSREFTDMIVTQRGYQANSKIITVSNEMLQELVNLVR